QTFGIAAKVVRRLDIVPLRVAVPVPDASDFLERPISLAKPFPQLALAGVAVAVHSIGGAAVIGVFVPQVVTKESGMIAVVFDERRQELPAGVADFRVIQAEARKSSSSAAAADAALRDASVTRHVASMRILAERPFGRGRDQFRDDDLDAILRGKVH